MDLPTLLTSLGLQKYISAFEEVEVDLAVFLTLTDNDLRECGITLFGPRRKMTSAIARYHSYASISQSRGGGAAGKDAILNNNNNNASETSWIESLDYASSNPYEKAYADKLEVEMQEMAIRLHQALAKEKESVCVAQKTRRQLDAVETNFQQILSCLYDLHKSLSRSRKLTGRAAQLGSELEKSFIQLCAPPPLPPPRREDDDNNRPADPASYLQSLIRIHAELESFTTMQTNGIDDLLRKFNRNDSSNGNGSA